MALSSAIASLDLRVPVTLTRSARRNWISRYSFTVILVIAAWAVRLMLDPFLGARHPFTTFYAAVTIAAWFGGFGPALLASLLGWFIADWWFTPPRHELGITDFSDLVALVTYLFVGVAVASFSGAMHAARLRAEEAATELANYSNHLEDMVRQRTAELRQSYDRLRLSERMAMMGMLSAGLGHDLGNLLFVCKARLDALAQRDPTPDTEADIRAIGQVMTYIEKLVKSLRLLAVDPDQKRQRSQTVLSNWWADTEPLLKTALPKRVELRAELPASLPEVKIDPSSLSQIIFNLVHNAGSVLRERRDGWVRVWARSDGASKSVVLGVSDNGPGMSAEIKQRCLEPFFTTGANPHSSGLGLALVQHLVQQASGRLDIETEPNQGTTFVMRLPVALDAKAEH